MPTKDYTKDAAQRRIAYWHGRFDKQTLLLTSITSLLDKYGSCLDLLSLHREFILTLMGQYILTDACYYSAVESSNLLESTANYGRLPKNQLKRIDMNCALVSQLGAGESARRLDDLPANVFEEEPLDLLKRTMAVVGPVYLGNRLVGLMFLGKKISGKRYSGYDLQVLQTLCSVSAVTFNNARLFDNVRASMDEVQKLSDLRNEMISRISHEFRTPLTAIRAVSACVPEFGMPPEMAAAMDSSITRLAELIDSLLALNSMSSVDYAPDPEVFNPLGPIHEIVSAHAEEATSKSLTFDIRAVADPGMVSVRASQQSFAAVLEKLIENAIHFSDKDSMIRIELEGVSREPDEAIDGALIVDWRNQTRKTIDEYRTLIEGHESESPVVEQHTESSRRTGPYLVVRITNTGIGIPKEELRFMGEPFRQASNSPDQRVKGTALGLAVAQKILADCGGRLCCSSKEGATTTFSVFFPAS